MATEANLFDLRNDQISISYSETSVSGDPLFTYNGTSFKPDVENATLGKIVTISLGYSLEKFSEYLSLIVPHVHLTDNKAEDVELIAIFWKQKTSYGGPEIVPGQVTTYRTVTLTGKARMIVS